MAERPAPGSAAEDDSAVTVACREFVELVTEYLEGTLPEAVERAIAAHLELCDACVVYLDQIRHTTAALRTLPTPTLPPAARDRLLAVFSAVHDGSDEFPRP